MKNYVDKNKLQEYTTKLTEKLKTIFATKLEVGSPLVASTVAEMTDTSRVYVYVGSESGYTSGNWYYYNGSAWTSGGVYNSTAFVTDATLSVEGKAADAKAVGDALANVEIEVDATLTQAGKAADAKATGDEINNLKDAVIYSKQLLNLGIHSSNDNSVTFNSDGSVTHGTTDYGNTFFGGNITLAPGTYYLFGVPAGFSFVNTSQSQTGAFVTNDTNELKAFTIENQTSCYVGFRISSTPSTAFTYYPGLYQDESIPKDNQKRLDVIDKTYYIIEPTGDTTDRRVEIEAILTTYKAIYFTPGEYTISTKLTLPNGSRLMGAGKSSALVFGSSAVGQMIECGNDCQISNLKIDGGLTSKPSDATANRHGIRVLDNKQTLQIHDCWITGFGGTGIRVDNTGYAQLSSIQINNCYFQYNGCAIHFLEHGEYGLVSNCSFIDNYIGALVKGGNNIVTGCTFERNTIGGSVNGASTSNSGHGAFIGCSFNHNTNTGLEIFQTSNGYIVSGCQMFLNEIKDISINASGVNVNGCNFGLSPKVAIQEDSILLITGNMFGSQPTMSIIDGAIIIGSNNYTFAGNSVPSLNTI